MQILILEGIATSGKTALINELSDSLVGHILILGEAQTHLPIMKSRGSLHLGFLEGLIKSAVEQNADIVIFDRLYLTQAFRAKKTIPDYKRIEDLLLKHSPTTIFLMVQEDAIADRISKAAAHRESEWGEHVKTKGSSAQEVAQYYIEQQRVQLELLKDSQIPHKVFDTTNNNFRQIAKQLKQQIK